MSSTSSIAMPDPVAGDAVSIPPEQLRAFLSEIPSETSPAERRLLFTFFQQSWNGRGKVIEIGPFLRGTTRASAFGMALNPHRSPEAELHTLDRFGAYYEPRRLKDTVAPMVHLGALTADDLGRFCANGQFLELFEAIHRPHPYFELLRVHDTPLPDFPEEVGTSQALDFLGAADEVSALFVDGCKSWASTHYALATLLPRMPVGAPLIFQDFGWYTCFWISAAVHALSEFLEWGQHVDSTYVFRVKATPSSEAVAALFPKAPAEKAPAFFQAAREALLQRSRDTRDLRGELIAHLHFVGAMITIGRKREAAEVLKTIDVRRFAAFANMLRGCIQSPTYRPGGKPIYWNEP